MHCCQPGSPLQSCPATPSSRTFASTGCAVTVSQPQTLYVHASSVTAARHARASASFWSLTDDRLAGTCSCQSPQTTLHQPTMHVLMCDDLAQQSRTATLQQAGSIQGPTYCASSTGNMYGLAAAQRSKAKTQAQNHGTAHPHQGPVNKHKAACC